MTVCGFNWTLIRAWALKETQKKQRQINRSKSRVMRKEKKSVQGKRNKQRADESCWNWQMHDGSSPFRCHRENIMTISGEMRSNFGFHQPMNDWQVWGYETTRVKGKKEERKRTSWHMLDQVDWGLNTRTTVKLHNCRFQFGKGSHRSKCAITRKSYELMINANESKLHLDQSICARTPIFKANCSTNEVELIV